MSTCTVTVIEGNQDTVSPEISSRELKPFLITEFDKTNETIKRVDSRLTLI